jgi:hypothetical protein
MPLSCASPSSTKVTPGPAATPTCTGGSPAAGKCSTISSAASTAPAGSRKWTITPSPSHFTGTPHFAEPFGRLVSEAPAGGVGWLPLA